MVKKPSVKDQTFASKLSRATASTGSLRTIIPFDLLSKLKLTAGDQLCWKLDDSKRLVCWKRTKKDKKIANDKVIDIKESIIPVKTDMKKVSLSTQGAETQPQITATNHI